MRTAKDEVGNRYGRLTVVREFRRTRQGVYWLCKCDCGNEYAVLGTKLRSGNTRSCGCLREMWFADRRALGFAPHGKERVVV